MGDRPLRSRSTNLPVIFLNLARIIIREQKRNHKFRVLETELDRNPDLYRIAEFSQQYLVRKGNSTVVWRSRTEGGRYWCNSRSRK